MMFCYGCKWAENKEDDNLWCNPIHCKKKDICVPAFHPNHNCKDFEEEKHERKEP